MFLRKVINRIVGINGQKTDFEINNTDNHGFEYQTKGIVDFEIYLFTPSIGVG